MARGFCNVRAIEVVGQGWVVGFNWLIKFGLWGFIGWLSLGYGGLLVD